MFFFQFFFSSIQSSFVVCCMHITQRWLVRVSALQCNVWSLNYIIIGEQWRRSDGRVTHLECIILCIATNCSFISCRSISRQIVCGARDIGQYELIIHSKIWLWPTQMNFYGFVRSNLNGVRIATMLFSITAIAFERTHTHTQRRHVKNVYHREQ